MPCPPPFALGARGGGGDNNPNLGRKSLAYLLFLFFLERFDRFCFNRKDNEKRMVTKNKDNEKIKITI
jgi:hypothetical protein